MTIIHVVLFHIPANADPSVVSEVFDAVRLLDKTCVRPQTGEPYIKSIKAGKNTLQGGHITHAFVFEFENAEDLAYYGDIDPAHQAVKAKIRAMFGVVAADLQAVDFTPDAF